MIVQRICLMLVLLGLTLVCKAAPATFSYRTKSSNVIGRWVNSNKDIIITFYKDGSYQEKWYGTDWVGKWEMKNDMVIVAAHMVNNDSGAKLRDLNIEFYCSTLPNRKELILKDYYIKLHKEK